MLHYVHMNTSYPHPKSHRELQALLRVIDRAYEQKELPGLEDAYDLAELLTEYKEALTEYIGGLANRVREGEDDSYFLYSEHDISAMRAELERQAYGDFDEAVEALAYDLNSLDRYQSVDDMEARVYRPEFFAANDRQKWDEWWQLAVDCLDHSYDSEADSRVGRALLAIRHYQQKSYGPLVPTLVATYRAGSEGLSVSLAWFDDALHIASNAPLHAELRAYLTNVSPVTNVSEFTPECLPKYISGYELRTVSEAKLFRYEL